MHRAIPLILSLFVIAVAPTYGQQEETAPPMQTDKNAIYNVRDFGATGDGTTLETAALQRAIDTCAKAGGGIVFCPPGDYLTGTLVLRSHVTLELSAGCTLWGSTNLDDYPSHVPAFRSYTDNYTVRSLIYAEKTEGTALVGRGTINGNGSSKSFYNDNGRPLPYKQRPYLMRYVECTHLLVQGITLKDSAMWTQHYLACEDVRIENVTVRTRTANVNGDGIDIDSCDRVIVTGCNIDCQDDAICLKSTSGKVCRNVVVSNCIITTHCNAFKCGTESIGGFEDIIVTDCTMFDTRLAGVAIETVDGGTVKNIVVSNLVMDNIGAPIFLRRGARYYDPYPGGQKDTPGEFSGVTIRDIEATNVTGIGCPIAGIPGYPIENVSISGIRVTFKGGGKTEDAAREIPENPAKYPDFNMFGMLPAYGFYVRHVRNLQMEGITVGFNEPDLRPALICDDVENFVLDRFAPERAQSGLPPVRLVDSRRICLRGWPPAPELLPFVRVEGARTKDIILDPMMMIAGDRTLDIAADVPETAVYRWKH